MAVCLALVLAGCSGKVASNPTATPTHLTTYSNATFHFSIRYDPARFSGGVNDDLSGLTTVDIPGVGWVKGAMFSFALQLKMPAGASRNGGEFQLTATRDPGLKKPTLASYRGERYMRLIQSHGWIVGSSEPVRIDGQPGFAYLARPDSGPFKGLTMADYLLYKNGVVYSFNLAARTAAARTVLPELNRVYDTFQITP